MGGESERKAEMPGEVNNARGQTVMLEESMGRRPVEAFTIGKETARNPIHKVRHLLYIGV